MDAKIHATEESAILHPASRRCGYKLTWEHRGEMRL